MTGRNDPCPCGSGKKFKQCCMTKSGKKKLTAKWLNQPAPKMPNLIERTFGEAINAAEGQKPPAPKPLKKINQTEDSSELS
jgi:uncharacterized protein